jgi:hypothetical protein
VYADDEPTEPRPLDLIVDHVRTRPDARALLVSHVVGPRSPVTFYQQYGFRLTGEAHEGEPILELDLYRA